ncbi:polysaccharide deacetylase family protein [Actinoplanes sp. N902-109]|uniref:polysaccharide deacetylase family protein n=1 Tax=Actinoplanes sp. (strain N902-109) TaxID=649831 RepID=UPI0003294F8D|nr:polysaccharide deacetylase family protein [Actinoplanes sp. N902-109]AGL16927.1 polysaccharide deacetylase [Actinoplanes sp. N902-109]
MKAARTALVAVGVLALVGFGGVVAAPAVAADSAPAQAQLFTRGYDTTKVVTLTFDLDWRTGTAAENAVSKANLDTILQVFAANSIVGGFGMTGRFAAQNPAEARNIADHGHKIFNHSYSHPDFMTLTQAQRWAQLDQTEAAFTAAGIMSAGWFRAPYRSGYTDAQLNRDLAARGFFINHDWTFDTTGYQAADWATVSSRIDRYTVPGAIIVMHVTIPSTDPGNLQRIIDKLKGMGYGFTTPFQALTKNAIRAKYLALGGPAYSGAPMTAEMPATTGTYVQWFQVGRIYWSVGTGAHVVRNAILGKYRGLGTVTGFLQFPTTDELPAANGGWYNDFQGGSIYWLRPTGAHEVHGAIRTKWLSLQGPAGLLGYPLSDEYAVANGRRSTFQHGAIVLDTTTGAVTVIYT